MSDLKGQLCAGALVVLVGVVVILIMERRTDRERIEIYKGIAERARHECQVTQ